MNSAEQRLDDRSQVQQLLATWDQAFLSHDLNQVLATYTEDVLAFDVMGPLQFKGRERYGQHWQACLDMCTGQPTVSRQDLEIEVSGDLALVHYLMHCSGTNSEGKEEGCWMRVSQNCRRQQGRWLICHEHLSVPVDMESGKAVFEAQPEG
jgi:uncharacterized protein (TIGR02246 family)